MSSSLPWSLLAAWVAYFGFLSTHQRHAARFMGASQAYLFALRLSTFLGILVGIGLLVHYAFHSAWYWPVILFLVGSIVAAFVFSAVEPVVGLLVLSAASFLGWPIAAWCVYSISSDPAKWW